MDGQIRSGGPISAYSLYCVLVRPPSNLKADVGRPGLNLGCVPTLEWIANEFLCMQEPVMPLRFLTIVTIASMLPTLAMAASPPASAKKPVTDEYHGVKVVDD